MLAGRSLPAVATGQLDAGRGFLLSANLCAGSDAATAVVRSGGASGTILCKLGAAAGLSSGRTFASGVPYSDLHATLSGTSPTLDVEVG